MKKGSGVPILGILRGGGWTLGGDLSEGLYAEAAAGDTNSSFHKMKYVKDSQILLL